MKNLLYVISFIFSVLVFSFVLIKKINFDQNCGGYLKLAADSNSIELAIENLNKAILYIESNDLTHGYTSVLWKTPDEDLGFWYKNIKQCQIDLSEVPSNASLTDKTNMLIKLRESLTDDGEKGITVTVPEGISRYPNNLMWGVLMWVSIILITIIGINFWFDSSK